MRWCLALVVAIGLLTSGCLGVGQSSSNTVQFTGTLSLAGGPGRPAGAPPLPANRTHVMVLHHGHVVGRRVSDAHGRFVISLPPGSYRLSGQQGLPILQPHFIVGATHRHRHFWVSIS